MKIFNDSTGSHHSQGIPTGFNSAGETASTANFSQYVDLLSKIYFTKLNHQKSISLEELSLAFIEATGFDLSNELTNFVSDWYTKVHRSVLLNIVDDYDHFFEIIYYSPLNIQIISDGQKHQTSLLNINKQEWEESLQSITQRHEVSWNYLNPYASFKLLHQGKAYRATLIHHSISSKGSSQLFLRKHSDSPFELNAFCEHEIEQWLKEEITSKHKNVLIAGATGSGKTSFIKSLLNLIPTNEHLILLEDTEELTTDRLNTTHLLHKPHSGKEYKEYLAYALRMSPNRLVLGEMRSNEVVPFLLAMNTGHKGLMSTIHADSAIDALKRIALLFSIFSSIKDISHDHILKMVCSNVDYVIYLKDKKVTEVIDVLGIDNSQPIFNEVFSLS